MGVFLRWIGLGGGILTLAAIAFLSSQSLRRVRTDTAWVDHTHQVLSSIATVRLLVSDAASNRRGLATNFEHAERDRYDDSQRRIDLELARLTSLVRDNPDQEIDAERLQLLLARWRSVLRNSITEQGRSGFVLSVQAVFSEQARLAVAAVHELARRMSEKENQLLVVREEDARASAENSRRIVIAGNVLGLILLIGAATISTLEARARRRAEAVLRSQAVLLEESRERYRTLFDSIDEGFCIIQMLFDERGEPFDYRFLEINPAFARQTGLLDARGKTMRELAPLHEEHWFQTYGRIAVTGEPLRFQNRAEQLNRWYDVYALRFGEPEKRQVAILFNDITDRTLFERTLSRQASELSNVNQELESFSYSVSHDLRAPLRAIDGFSQALLEESGDRLDESGKRYLGRVRAAAQRMAQLIDDLLSLSRFSRQPLERTTVDLTKIAREAFALISREYPDRKAAFEAPHPIKADADEGLLRIALQNLIGNAWKFTARRENAKIEFGVQHDGGEPRYFVRDNGAGFDMAYAGKLFGAFQRLHTESEFSGTGIGLATVARIVHRHGGRVWAEGRVGEGATFWFTL